MFNYLPLLKIQHSSSLDYFINAQRHVTESPEREEEYRRRQDEERRRIHAEHLRRVEEARRERERQVMTSSI